MSAVESETMQAILLIFNAFLVRVPPSRSLASRSYLSPGLSLLV